jgi:hypothetical protein
MAPAILSVTACLILFVWRLVFSAQQRRLAASEADARRAQQNGLLEQGLHILRRTRLVIVGSNDRPKSFLLRIVALTGAKEMGNGYDLNVGAIKFHVRDGYVGRLRETDNPKGRYEETCFYSAEKGMPKAEQTATVLLQLKNNPALFDRWAAQCGAFKADGQAFGTASDRR